MARRVAESWLGRLLTLLFSALFIAVGFWAGVQPIAGTLQQAWTVRDWQPTKAWVDAVELREHQGRKGGRTYKVLARYRYQVGERWLQSTRIGLDESAGADNIGDWQQRWQARLRIAQQSGAGVVAYVNPRQPEQALLDRRPRWGLLSLHLLFALAFGGIGLVAGWLAWRCPDKQPASRS